MNKADLRRELQKIHDVLEQASVHFMYEGKMNAALHMSNTIRYAPLATAVIGANEDMTSLISNLNNEEEESAEESEAYTERLLRRAQAIMGSVTLYGATIAVIVEDDIIYAVGSSATRLKSINMPGTYLEVQGTSVWYQQNSSGESWMEERARIYSDVASFVVIRKSRSH